MMIHKLALLRRYHAPAGDAGSDTGGSDTATLDRGDDLLPDDDSDLDPDKPEEDLKDPFADKAEETKAEDKDEEEDKDEDDKPKGKKDSRIPLNRHKEILAKERAQREALERQLAQYQQGQQVAETNEQITTMEDKILSMEKQYNKLLSDGEVEKASDLMSLIRKSEREIVETKAEMRAQVAEARARESARYDMALERIEEAYPELNPDADEYDKELLTDVADLKQVYQNRGMTPTKALQAAVKKLLGAEDRTQKTATEVAPRVTDKDVAAERKKQAVAKTTDAAKRTPPSTRDVGIDSDKAGKMTSSDIMKMDQDAFSKLTDEQLAKMRGDIV
jgi:hypothetical protein